MAAILLLSSTTFTGDVATLSLEARVADQERIDAVYLSHRTGVRKELSPDAARLNAGPKVEETLKWSVALDRIWHAPITQSGLRRELERIARDTSYPERLDELFAALGNDPVRVQEGLVRPVLAQRLGMAHFAFDPVIHAPRRHEAGRIADEIHMGHSPDAGGFDRTTQLVARRGSALPPSSAAFRLDLEAGEFDRLRRQSPAALGQPGPVREDADAFRFDVVLEEGEGWARIATHSVAKLSPQEWLSTLPDPDDEGALAVRADATVHLESLNLGEGSAAGCPGEPTWDAVGLQGPDPGSLPAVWTGTEMIVWGGSPLGERGTGTRYDPEIDAWRAMSRSGAPAARSLHSAIWTGTEMIIWGGAGASGAYFGDGRRYDPVLDQWSAISNVGAPAPRYRHSAVWTGSEMVVWGGIGQGFIKLQSGARYDPATDVWSAMTTAGAPEARIRHTAITNGDTMLVWGGQGSAGAALNSGARYDASQDTWAPISTTAAPAARVGHVAVWTGTKMVVWGGGR